MRRFTKGLLAVLLVVTVAVSAFAITGIFSSAQAIPNGVFVAFSGTNDDNDWVTLSGTTIQDKALTFTVTNGSDETIVLREITSSGTKITYTGWTQGEVMAPGAVTPIKIAGTTTNNAVLTVTVTYYVQGNPIDTTKETATAYIYCSSSNAYSEYAAACGIESGLFRYGVDTTLTLFPVNSASVSQRGKYTQEPTITAAIYVDGSKYTTWADLNAKINFANGKIRDHAFWDKITVEHPANCGGSFKLLGYGTEVGENSFTSTYNKDSEEDDKGFFCQVGENANTDMTITGQIPTAASTQIDVSLRGYGQTGGIYGVLSSKTGELKPIFNITVYNNNKSALRQRLQDLEELGLNKASYKSGWDNYETALKTAYTVLGTQKKSASDVSTALNNLNSKFNALVRYAVVYTNHYYYEGTNSENPTLFKQEIKMDVTNNSTISPTVLTSGTNGKTFNRSNVTKSIKINVSDSTNYTAVIDQYYWYVDTRALEDAVAEQRAKLHEDEVGTPLYTEDTWNAYKTAADEGETIANDATKFQDDIDAAKKAITDAKAALVRLDIDTEWLDEGMTWAEQILNGDFEEDFGLGWTTDLFASDYAGARYTALETAYNNAAAVTSDPEFTKSQADTACAALWAAIDNLRVVDETTAGLFLNNGVRHADIEKYGYYQGLKESQHYTDENGLIDVFNDIVNRTGAYADLNPAEFTEESWEALQSALYGDFAEGSYACAETDAYPSYDGESELTVPAYSMIHNIWFLASQADYNACRDNLIDKVNNLEWVIDESKVERLQAKYAEAEEIDLDLYYPESTAKLVDDLEYLEEQIAKLDEPQVYGDPYALKDELMDAFYAELVNAIAQLSEKPVIVVPETNDVGLTATEDYVAADAAAGQTVDQVLESLDLDIDTRYAEAVVLDKDGNAVEGNTKMATGFQIKVQSLDGDNVYIDRVYIAKGDLFGDAEADGEDLSLVLQFAFTDNGIEVDSISYLAGDLNGDGVVDLSDAIMLDEMIG